MQKLVKLVKVNNLQYNANRDPEFYRRTPNQEFRIQALLGDTGTAKGRFEVDGKILGESTISLPGTFESRCSFSTPGTRIGRLTIEGNGETYRQDIRLDVLEHEWVG